jgi:hypothetical protein
VADITPPTWRDLSYGFCALGLGLAAHFSGSTVATFWLVAISVALLGDVL